jgi:hypothetical protein
MTSSSDRSPAADVRSSKTYEVRTRGPYVEEVDAQQRVSTLREFKGDGVIENGEFGQPAGLTIDAGSQGGVMAGV